MRENGPDGSDPSLPSAPVQISDKGTAAIREPEGISGKRRIDVHLGARVRRRRLQLGISEARLATELGTSVQQLAKYEDGAQPMSASTLFSVARALGVSIAYLFDDEPGSR